MALNLTLPEPKPLGDPNFRAKIIAFFTAFTAFEQKFDAFFGGLDVSKIEAIEPYANTIKAVGKKNGDIDKVNNSLDKVVKSATYY